MPPSAAEWAPLVVARRPDVPVMENNAHSLFGEHKGRWLGTFGFLAAQSLHETKNTAGVSGKPTTNNSPGGVAPTRCAKPMCPRAARERGTCIICCCRRCRQHGLDRPPEVTRHSVRLPLRAAASVGHGPEARRESGRLPSDRGHQRPLVAAAVLQPYDRGGTGAGGRGGSGMSGMSNRRHHESPQPEPDQSNDRWLLASVAAGAAGAVDFFSPLPEISDH